MRKEKKTGRKIGKEVVIGTALTVAGFVFVPKMIDKLSNRIYKASYKKPSSEDFFEDDIVVEYRQKEEGKNGRT